MPPKPKLLVVLGLTASGKSEVAVRLARRFNGEVISADSRQIYRGLDVGSGKITEEEMGGVPHHLLDVAESTDNFSAADFKRLADAVIADIHTRGKIPVLTGGTGFYLQTVVDDVVPPEVPPNAKRREELAELTAPQLLQKLRRLDPKRAETVDAGNPRRLIRAIEIAEALGAVPPIKKHERFDALQIGLSVPMDKLEKRIAERTDRRLAEGWVEEVVALRECGLPRERLDEFGLGYTCIGEFLDKKLPENKLAGCIVRAEHRYAKRQVRWFKRDPRIKWFSPNAYEMIEKVVAEFLQ